jgi:hypothetical protein
MAGILPVLTTPWSHQKGIVVGSYKEPTMSRVSASPFTWAYDTWHGTGAYKHATMSSTTVSCPIVSTVAVGKVLVVACITKPDDHTQVTDSGGNTYDPIEEHSKSNCCACSLWITKVTTQLTTSDTITLTTNPGSKAMSIMAMQFSFDSGKTYSVVDHNAAEGNSVAGSVTVPAMGSLASGNYLYVGEAGIGTSQAVTTEDADFTYFGIGTGGSPAGTNVVGSPAFFFATSSTGTTFTTEWGWGGGGDWVAIMGAIAQVNAIPESRLHHFVKKR